MLVALEMLHFPLSLMNRLIKTESATFISLFWFRCSWGINFLPGFLLYVQKFHCLSIFLIISIKFIHFVNYFFGFVFFFLFLALKIIVNIYVYMNVYIISVTEMKTGGSLGTQIPVTRTVNLRDTSRETMLPLKTH